jgi:hypothetical protein
MPSSIKLRHAQEMFLLLLVDQELSPYEAYARAYPKAKPEVVPASVSRLLSNAKVQERKEQLERAKALVVRASTRVTASFITKRLMTVYDEALSCKQLAAASAAMLGIAKLHGLLVEKHQVDAIVRRPSLNLGGPDVMTEDQWLQEFSPMVIEHNHSEDPSEVDTTNESATIDEDDGSSVA